MKVTQVTLAALVLATVSCVAPADDGGPALRVHLPRTVSVDGERLCLGVISLVRADDDALARKVSAIAMGRAPWSKEKLVINRPTILGRLATHGVSRDEVGFSGAEKVVVTRNEEVVKSGRIVNAAEAFLATTRPAPNGCRWRLICPPNDLYAPAGSDVLFKPRMVPHGARGEAKVEVMVTAAGKTLAGSRVVFRMAYRNRRLVAKRDILPGGVITPENTKLHTTTADNPEPVDWAAPYGQRAIRIIPAGAAVRRGMVRPARAEVLVRRNKSVVMRIAANCFQITTLGQALEDGREGDFIRVRNVDSKRIVVAKVADDGTVQPVFGKR